MNLTPQELARFEELQRQYQTDGLVGDDPAWQEMMGYLERVSLGPKAEAALSGGGDAPPVVENRNAALAGNPTMPSGDIASAGGAGIGETISGDAWPSAGMMPDTEIGTKMMDPTPFASKMGAPAVSGNAISNWWGGLKGMQQAGLVMTGIGAALYMSTREKQKQPEKWGATGGGMTSGPSMAQSNPYAIAAAGSPQTGAVMPQGFQLQ